MFYQHGVGIIMFSPHTIHPDVARRYRGVYVFLKLCLRYAHRMSQVIIAICLSADTALTPMLRIVTLGEP